MVLPEFTITSEPLWSALSLHVIGLPHHLFHPIAHTVLPVRRGETRIRNVRLAGTGLLLMTNANSCGFISRAATEQCLDETMGTDRLPGMLGYVVPIGNVLRQPSAF
jgi:hypothetical protein